jgi:hypothetical protein
MWDCLGLSTVFCKIFYVKFTPKIFTPKLGVFGAGVKMLIKSIV